tara:strand:- start:1968 stop:2927 length:960 start_codon:yes stop_codon:yes gene_type:complete
MGIRLLNRFLKESCKTNVIHFNQLENKKIAIDIYNYIYRFLGNNRLLEELDSLCCSFHRYKIRPLFVFDGKNREEKKEELEKRRIQRDVANKEYEKIIAKFEKSPKSLKLKKKLTILNRERVKLTKWDIVDVKKYLDLSGMKYIDANGEAEELCTELVNKNKVFACMSEDTDLFAFGCKRIIRSVHFKKETFVMYEMEHFLNYLNLDIDSFRMVCTLSYNDYTNTNARKHFIYFINLLNLYKQLDNNCSCDGFVKWLVNNNYILNDEEANYYSVKDIYNLSDKNLMKNMKFISIQNGNYNKRKINELFIDRKMYLNGSK